jgi:hypothetical protein
MTTIAFGGAWPVRECSAIKRPWVGTLRWAEVFWGTLALVTVCFGAITSNAMNDYSGSLALKAAGVRLKRNWSAGARNRVRLLLDPLDPSGQYVRQVPKCVALQRVVDCPVSSSSTGTTARASLPTQVSRL